MIVQAIKAKQVITPNQCTVEELLDDTLPTFSEGSVLAVTSKIVALCEGDVVAVSSISKDDLVRQQADRYVMLQITNTVLFLRLLAIRSLLARAWTSQMRMACSCFGRTIRSALLTVFGVTYRHGLAYDAWV